MLTLLFLGAAIFPGLEPNVISGLKLNQIQVVGTHNSYHLRPPSALFKTVTSVAADAKEWDYSRQTLDQQFDHGVRSIELDMHLMGDEWLVMHVPLVDPGSTVRTFKDAILLTKKWSDQHPGHVPISFLMELKEEGAILGKAFRQPELRDLERMDTEIREVFPADRIITPDDVRADYPTLFAAVGAGNWPTLAEAAGKVLFVMHETGRNRDLYTRDHPSLQGRAMFVESNPGADHAAVLVLNNPRDPRITEKAKEGYLIRTRGDTRTRRNKDEREAGLASGAHVVTTDYPAGEAPEDIAFSLPEQAPARVNPITGPRGLAEQLITEPIPNK